MRWLFPLLFVLGCTSNPQSTADASASDMAVPAHVPDLMVRDLVPCAPSSDLAERPPKPIAVDSPIVVGDNAELLAVADFDGDGKADLLEYLGGANPGLLLRAGNGDGSFASPSVVWKGFNAFSQTAAAVDLDGDGILDIVIGSAKDSRVAVLLGLGQGTFNAPVATPIARVPEFLAVADFDGDGRPDVAVSDRLAGSPQTVSILHNNGKGALTLGPAVSLGNTVGGGPIIATDWNGDGKIDLGAALIGDVSVGSGSGVVVLLGKGDGTFGGPSLIPIGGGVNHLAAGDWNGDKIMDFAVTTERAGVNVLLGLGNGAFGLPLVTTATGDALGLSAADFNGDGKLDLAIQDTGRLALAIVLGKGDGHFGDPRYFVAGDLSAAQAPGSAWTPVTLSDVNGDGKTDVALAGAFGPTILLGTGDGSFASGLDYPAGKSPTGLGAADFNHDGHMDLVTTSGDNQVRISFGTNSPSARTLVALPGVNNPWPIALGDFNGDGETDLAAGEWGVYDAGKHSYSGSGVSVFLGRHDGTFGARVHFDSGQSPVALVAADLDGDGHLDLASANNGDASISILLGRGDGSFATAVSRPIGARPWTLVAGDFDGNRTIDLAVGRLGDPFGPLKDQGGLAFLSGDGKGGFANAVDLIAGPENVVVAGDVLGDGRSDLIAIGNSNNPEQLFVLAACAGTLAPGAPRSLAEYRYSAALADLDGNGLPDLIVTRPGDSFPGGGPFCAGHCPSPGISIYLNRGTGKLDDPIERPAGYAPYGLVATDLDGDGRIDLAIANAGGSTISILRNKKP